MVKLVLQLGTWLQEHNQWLHRCKHLLILLKKVVINQTHHLVLLSYQLVLRLLEIHV
jgi:hypothetical protein